MNNSQKRWRKTIECSEYGSCLSSYLMIHRKIENAHIQPLISIYKTGLCSFNYPSVFNLRSDLWVLRTAGYFSLSVTCRLIGPSCCRSCFISIFLMALLTFQVCVHGFYRMPYYSISSNFWWVMFGTSIKKVYNGTKLFHIISHTCNTNADLRSTTSTLSSALITWNKIARSCEVLPTLPLVHFCRIP